MMRNIATPLPLVQVDDRRLMLAARDLVVEIDGALATQPGGDVQSFAQRQAREMVAHHYSFPDRPEPVPLDLFLERIFVEATVLYDGWLRDLAARGVRRPQDRCLPERARRLIQALASFVCRGGYYGEAATSTTRDRLRYPGGQLRRVLPDDEGGGAISLINDRGDDRGCALLVRGGGIVRATSFIKSGPAQEPLEFTVTLPDDTWFFVAEVDGALVVRCVPHRPGLRVRDILDEVAHDPGYDEPPLELLLAGSCVGAIIGWE